MDIVNNSKTDDGMESCENCGRTIGRSYGSIGHESGDDLAMSEQIYEKQGRIICIECHQQLREEGIFSGFREHGRG